MRPIVAAFDFDGTLTYRDTLFPFLTFSKGYLKAGAKLIFEAPYLLLYLVGIVTRQQAKERVLTRFFCGETSEHLRAIGREFADRCLDRHLKQPAIQRLRWHQKQGHRCILISASVNVYLEPWAERMGFEKVICSEMEITPEGKATGKLVGLNCWGPEKARRLKEFLCGENCELYAYGDSRGDQELLSMANRPYYRTLPENNT